MLVASFVTSRSNLFRTKNSNQIFLNAVKQRIPGAEASVASGKSRSLPSICKEFFAGLQSLDKSRSASNNLNSFA